MFRENPWVKVTGSCVWPLIYSSCPSVSAGPSFSPWTDPEIKIFLQEWQVVEREFGHPGQKIKQKSSLVCQRLYHRGLFKDIQSCLDLMWTLKDLHSTLSRERSRTVPLFSPYRDYLERIFDPKCQRGHVPGESLLHRHLGFCKWWHQMACPSWGQSWADYGVKPHSHRAVLLHTAQILASNV